MKWKIKLYKQEFHTRSRLQKHLTDNDKTVEDSERQTNSSYKL